MKKIKDFFNDQSKFNNKDLILLLIIITIYTIISFINFGTTKSPNTFYNINKNGIILELKEEVSTATLLYYNGEESGSYNIYLSNDGINYTTNKFIVMKSSGAFSWDEGSIDYEIKKEA